MTMTRTEAFAHFGVTLRNHYSAWSGQSPDKSKVALTVWRDRLSGGVYRRDPFPESDRRKQGFKWLMEDLAWARDHCGGRLYGVWGTNESTTAQRKIKTEATSPCRFMFRLIEFDPVTGAHAAAVDHTVSVAT
jgi:hypothetical protein